MAKKMVNRMTKNRKRKAIPFQDSPRPGKPGYQTSRRGGLFSFMAVGGGHCGSSALRFLFLFIWYPYLPSQMEGILV